MENDQPDQAPNEEDFTTADNGLAIAGFVLAFVLPLLGLIFSIVGLRRAEEIGGQGRGLAVAGIVIGAVFSILALLWLLALVVLVGPLSSQESPEIVRRNFILKTFNADTADRSVLVASGDLTNLPGADTQLRYQPAQPETCRYLLTEFRWTRAEFDVSDETVAYSQPLLINPAPADLAQPDLWLGDDYYVLADGCGDWQLINQLGS